MAGCRITSIKPDCGYKLFGVEEIKILDYEDFSGVDFYGDNLYDRQLIDKIYKNADFTDVAKSDNSRYNSTTQNGIYSHTLQTFVDDLSASILSNIHLASKRRYVVLFKANNQKYYLFGYDSGATFSHTEQTDDSIGSSVTLTAQSEYLLFEVIPGAWENDSLPFVFIPDFINGAFCSNGFKQAIIASKTSLDGLELDVNSIPVSISGRKQAIALLEGYDNPNPSLYELETTFLPGEMLYGIPTIQFDLTGCPIGYISIDKSTLILEEPSVTGTFTLISSSHWRLVSGPTEFISLDYLSGSAGTYIINATGINLGAGTFIFENQLTKQTASIYIANVSGRPWILQDGTWNMLGFWYNDGIWNY